MNTVDPGVGPELRHVKVFHRSNSGLFDPRFAGQIDPRYSGMSLNLAPFRTRLVSGLNTEDTERKEEYIILI